MAKLVNSDLSPKEAVRYMAVTTRTLAICHRPAPTIGPRAAHLLNASQPAGNVVVPGDITCVHVF